MLQISCPECGGSGSRPCENCDGQGRIPLTAISTGEAPPTEGGRRALAELRELQHDERRLTDQARRLSALRPHRRAAYEAQLAACLREVQKQAERATDQLDHERWVYRRAKR